MNLFQRVGAVLPGRKPPLVPPVVPEALPVTREPAPAAEQPASALSARPAGQPSPGPMVAESFADLDLMALLPPELRQTSSVAPPPPELRQTSSARPPSAEPVPAEPAPPAKPALPEAAAPRLEIDPLAPPPAPGPFAGPDAAGALPDPLGAAPLPGEPWPDPPDPVPGPPAPRAEPSLWDEEDDLDPFGPDRPEAPPAGGAREPEGPEPSLSSWLAEGFRHLDAAPDCDPGPPDRPASPAAPAGSLAASSSLPASPSLAAAVGIAGLIGACLVDGDSGLLLAAEGGPGLDLDAAAALAARVVQAERQAVAALGLDDALEDILVTTGGEIHVIRPLRRMPALFLYLALDRTAANLGMARVQLDRIEAGLGF